MTHNINLKTVSFDIFAKPKMKQITKHNLYNNTKPGDLNSFAVDGDQIKVKFNPADTELYDTLTAGDGVRFLIDYKYITQDVLNQYPERKVKIRVMATLSSYIDDVSPQIMNYRLIAD